LYISHLLGRPGERVHVIDLVQADTSGNLIVELKGNQTATRITVNTTIDQVL